MKMHWATTIILTGILVSCGNIESEEPPALSIDLDGDASSSPYETRHPDQIDRVSKEIVHRKITEDGALLICAYENEPAVSTFALPGSMTLAEFEKRAAEIPKDQELFFYCA